eukprot:jgi/Botrbrau1/23659/Bobra.55_2s0042.1
MGGRTLLCSIHQPRQQIWDMFDFVTLLSEGFLIFYGRPSEAVPWFEETQGFKYEPETCGFRADWLLDQISVHFHHSSSGQQGFRSVADLQQAAAQLSAKGLQSLKLEKGASTSVSLDGSSEDATTNMPFASEGSTSGGRWAAFKAMF